jgi:hypothetical protein
MEASFGGENGDATSRVAAADITVYTDRPDRRAMFEKPDLVFKDGRLIVRDGVVVAASGQQSRVARILGPDGDQATTAAGEAVTICLADEVDVAHGASPKPCPTSRRTRAARG